MEYRQLGGSGFKVPALSLGTGTFGGGNEFFKSWGTSDVAEATRLVDICLEAGMTMFDSADVYSGGMAEEILGQAIKGRRNQLLISTKGTFRTGPGPNRSNGTRKSFPTLISPAHFSKPPASQFPATFRAAVSCRSCKATCQRTGAKVFTTTTTSIPAHTTSAATTAASPSRNSPSSVSDSRGPVWSTCQCRRSSIKRSATG